MDHQIFITEGHAEQQYQLQNAVRKIQTPHKNKKQKLQLIPGVITHLSAAERQLEWF